MNPAEISEDIVNRCLQLDSLLKTIQKALEQDGQNIDGFTDYYSDLIQQAADMNWQNHDMARDIPCQQYKLDKIRDLVN